MKTVNANNTVINTYSITSTCERRVHQYSGVNSKMSSAAVCYAFYSSQTRKSESTKPIFFINFSAIILLLLLINEL